MRRRGFESGLLPTLRNIERPDLSSQVTKALGLQSPPPLSLDPATQLGIALRDLTTMEYRYLRLESTFSAVAVVAAGVGFKSFAQLQGTRGTLTVVRRVYLVNLTAAAQTYEFGTSRGNGTTTGTFSATSDDDRPGLATLNPATTMTIGNTTAAPFRPKNLFSLAAGASAVIDVEAVLSGRVDNVGNRIAFSVAMQTANAQLDCAFVYTERPLDPSET